MSLYFTRLINLQLTLAHSPSPWQVVLAAILQFAALTPMLPFFIMKVDATLIAELVLAFGFYFILRGGGRVARTALDLPVVGFLLACTLATVGSVNPFISFFPSVSRGDGLLIYIAYGAVGVMAARLTRKEISTLIVFLLVAGVFIGTIAMLQYYGLDATHLFRNRILPFGRSWGTLGNPIFLGGYLSLVFPLALVLTMHAPGPRWPWYAAASLILYGALVASETRTAWLACAVAAAVLVWLVPASEQRLRRWVVLAVGCAAMTTMMVLTQPQVHLAQRSLSLIDPQDSSLQGRLFIWKSVVPLIEQRPIFGWGFSALARQHPGMTTPVYFQMLGDNAVDAVHNELLHIAFATGLLGLVAYLWIWGQVVRSLWASVRKSGIDGQLDAGLFASMVAYFIWLQTGWSVVGPANVFWALAGAAVALGQGAPPEPQTRSGVSIRSALWPMRRLARAEPALAAAIFAVLIVTVLPAYRAAQQIVADEERLQAAESWHILHHTAQQEMREIAGRWRSLAWSCFLRTSDTRSCASNDALGFHDTAVNWELADPTYLTTLTSITMIVRGAARSPLVADERYTVILNTSDGTTRDGFVP